ncbi:DnaA ATPase domain-containing protein [Veillonella intestinalis]|uniref:DnaA ATPase domain-containing protein n=1 Tax=Veillonella intestinalis TaxID=2941341 RepID=UPI00203EA0B7|nr:DnaA/Hda family protein [Veillonella intestinalis]
MKDTINTDILKRTDTIVKADARHTFDTVAAALGAEEHNPLVVVGTEDRMAHVGEIVKREALTIEPNLVILEKNGQELVQAYTDSVTYGYVADFMETFVKIDMLLVSEFDYVVREADELSQRALHRLFEALIRNQRQVVFTMTQEPNTYDELALPKLFELVNSGALVIVK